MSSSASVSGVLPPSLSQRYRVTEVLGKGTYGYVFRGVERLPPHREVAIKKFRGQLAQMASMFGMDQTTNRELGSLLELGDHVNIVQLLSYEHAEEEKSSSPDVGCGEGNIDGIDKRSICGSSLRSTNIVYFFVFELCDYDLERILLSRHNPYNQPPFSNGACFVTAPSHNNRSLSISSISKHGGHLSEELVKVLAYQLLQATAFCHSLRVVHRDLKPANLLIAHRDFHANQQSDANQMQNHKKTNQPFLLLKVADFGLASSLGSESGHPRTEEVVTVLYRAPEIVLGDANYTAAVDVWAIGTIVAEMIRGQPLFNGNGEFDVLMRCFALLGTPDVNLWPKLKTLKFFDERLPVCRSPDRLSRLRGALSDPTTGECLMSDEGIKFLDRLLVYNPSRRLSASEALNHPWFKDIDNLIPFWLKEAYKSPNPKMNPIPPHILSPPSFNFNPKDFIAQIMPTNTNNPALHFHS